MLKANKKRTGFTLIELLVVISIIAILMAILMPALSKVRQQARKTVCGTRLKDVGTTFRLYRADNNDKLPPSWALQSELDNGFQHGDKRWFVRIQPYYNLDRWGDTGVYAYEMFKCPIMEDWTRKNRGGEAAAGIYGYNWFFTETDARDGGTGKFRDWMWWKKPSGIKNPSELPLVADLDARDPLARGREGASGWRMAFQNPHPAAYEYGWMDGDIRSQRHHYYGPAPNHGRECNFLMADNHVESRDVTKAGQWPWLGDTPQQQQSGRAFHPTRSPQ